MRVFIGPLPHLVVFLVEFAGFVVVFGVPLEIDFVVDWRPVAVEVSDRVCDFDVLRLVEGEAVSTLRQVLFDSVDRLLEQLRVHRHLLLILVSHNLTLRLPRVSELSLRDDGPTAFIVVPYLLKLGYFQDLGHINFR